MNMLKKEDQIIIGVVQDDHSFKNNKFPASSNPTNIAAARISLLTKTMPKRDVIRRRLQEDEMMKIPMKA